LLQAFALVDEGIKPRSGVLKGSADDAANGEAGWKLIESGEPFDLVLSDVVMPGALSGYDLIRKVKAKYPGIATLLTSGHVSAALRDLDAADPKVRLLSKPYSLRDLAEAVAQALKQVREAM
jgi:CheY-like chemotaxis protein